MTLILRTFKNEDAKEVVRLFNSCFQSYRTLDEWKWMYLKMPDFDASGILVAEDQDSRKIVGSLVVCRHPVSINGNRRFVGIIDDVDTSPRWRGRGIATKLVKMAIEYCKRRDCSAIFLYAKPSAEASGIYRRLGFRDARSFYYNGKIAGIRFAAKNLPFPISLAGPIAALLSGTNLRGYKTSEAKVEAKQLHCDNELEFGSYLEALNSSLRRMSLFYPYSKERLAWMICRAPRSISPVARFIERSGEILCGANASIYRMKLFGRTFNTWVIGDIFTAPHLQDRAKQLYVQYLLAKMNQDGQERKCALQMVPLDPYDDEMKKMLRPSGFLRFVSAVFMCFPLDKAFSLPSRKTPWYFWKQHMIGVP